MDVIIFLLDGCRADAIDKADTPIMRELIKKGFRAQKCSTVYPSLTGPGHISILTGAYPEKTGIVGHFYWDKKEKQLYDIFSDKYCEVETIFETLSHNNVNGINFGAYMRRGSKDSYTRQLLRKAAGKVSSSKQLMALMDRSPIIYKFLRGFVVGRYGEFLKAFESGEYKFYYVAFTEVDKAGHKYGPESDKYYETIEGCDKKIGDLLSLADSLKRDVGIIITADHGQTTLQEKLSLDTLNLNEVGYLIDEAYDYSGAQIVTYNKDKENMAVAAVVSRHVQMWLHETEDIPKVVKLLTKRKGITHVRTKDELREDRLCHDRVGDLTFSLAQNYGFDFLPMAENGDHGSISPTDMHVPLIVFNGHAKTNNGLNNNVTVDVAPTVFTMLGLTNPPHVQGCALFKPNSSRRRLK
jgi:predicted AlkP superfamily pyrophosphatase or phosphodiesterase